MSELSADDIRWHRHPPERGEELDYDLVFTEAEKLDNPLAVPLVAALQGVRRLQQERDDARIDRNAERALRQSAFTELARVTAQLDAARRTITALRSEAARR